MAMNGESLKCSKLQVPTSSHTHGEVKYIDDFIPERDKQLAINLLAHPLLPAVPTLGLWFHTLVQYYLLRY
jgi:hypothetical protein